jgi:hypothetical protein
MISKNIMVSAVAISTITMLLVAFLGTQIVSAHERRLYTIGDQDYLFVVGSINEPVFVDDRSGVVASVYSPDSTDPMNSQANGTMPAEGLTLKVDVSAGGKNMTLDLEPAFGEAGNYEAVFYPIIPTTYNYTEYGDINGIAFRDTFTCSPAGESEPAQDNSTVVVSDGVTRIGQSGGFGCIESRADVSFPEQYVSNYELQQMINSQEGSSNSTSMP